MTRSDCESYAMPWPTRAGGACAGAISVHWEPLARTDLFPKENNSTAKRMARNAVHPPLPAIAGEGANFLLTSPIPIPCPCSCIDCLSRFSRAQIHHACLNRFANDVEDGASMALHQDVPDGRVVYARFVVNTNHGRPDPILHAGSDAPPAVGEDVHLVLRGQALHMRAPFADEPLLHHGADVLGDVTEVDDRRPRNAGLGELRWHLRRIRVSTEL